MSITKEKVAAQFLMIIPGWLACARENELAGGLEKSVHLAIAHQRLLVVALPPAHVIGIADLARRNRLASGRWRILAAGANKQACVRGIARHQCVESLLRRPSRWCRRKLALVIVGEDLQRDIRLLEVLLAGRQRLLSAIVGCRTPIQRREHKDENDHDQ